MMRLLYFGCLCYILTLSSAFVRPQLIDNLSGNNPAHASFVTSFINSGDIEKGRKNCTVQPVKGNITSYAGFFTVNPQYNSNMFFWFFPALSGPTSPVVLWLQGGPGATSLSGVFEEHGPFYVEPNGELKLRKHTWIRNVSMLYIDNPVGTGYSFTESDKGYAKNEDDVAINLLSAVTQFFTLFPELQKNSFFISGESYAGKYVPALAYSIDKQNAKQRRNGLRINLIGITLGNALCDPEHMMGYYGKYLNQIGLIDENGMQQFQAIESKIVTMIQNKQYEAAFNEFDALLNGDISPYKSLFFNLTGFTNYFNYRFQNEISPYGDFAQYIQSDVARRAIHVGTYKFNTDKKVETFLMNDVMQSVKPWIESLLEKKYKVLFYNGQLDIIIAYPLTIQFINNLNWSGKELYKNASRSMFLVEKEIAGYYKVADNLIEVLVRNAGHMVPKDQPLWLLELISRFTYNLPL